MGFQISNALPIQFWLNGIPTFNEKEEAGITHECYFHPINCEDEQTLQFTDTELREYKLNFFDEDGVLLLQLPFLSELNGEGGYTYTLTFTFDEIDICDTLVKTTIAYYENPIEGGITAPIGLVEGDIIQPNSGLFGRGADPEDTCLGQIHTYYWLGVFGVGTFIYLDPGLTTPVNWDFVSSADTDIIYAVNDTTGEVLSEEGACSS